MLLRNLPDFKGKNLLVKTLYKGKIEAAKDIQIKGKYNCTYLVPNLTEAIGFCIFTNGIYEPETIQLIVKTLPENGVMLDLGANIGAVSVPVAVTRPDVRILAVEAAPWIFSYLKSNIAANKLEKIETINKALFDSDDVEIDFFVPDVKFGKGSLSPVFTKNAVKVKTIKVDTLVKQFNLNKVDLIKIDVEGFEYFVFNGALSLLQSGDAPDIIFEFVDWAEKNAMNLKEGSAQALLIDLGYNLYRMEGAKLVPLQEVQVSGACNIFASKKALAKA